MFASFLWTVVFVTVCRADGSAMEHRLKPFWASEVSAALSEVARRRDEGADEPSALEDGVTTMSAQAGFRYKNCIKDAPFGGFTKMILTAWSPAILGDLMDFSTERRRWGFNKNNFVENIALPMEGLACESIYQVCTIKAMRVFQSGLAENQSSVMSKYFPFVSSTNIDFFVGCAYEEIPAICSEFKTLMCSEGEN